MARFDLWVSTRANIDGIADFTAEQWGKARVLTYLDTLETGLQTLAGRPAMGRRRDDIAPGLMSFPFGKHVVFHRRARYGFVVVRILRERQDPARNIH